MSFAHLTEPGTKRWVRYALYLQRERRHRVQGLIFNSTMFLAFVLCLSVVLYYRYKRHKDPLHRKRREAVRKQYIMSTLQRLAAVQSNAAQITELPPFGSPVEP